MFSGSISENTVLGLHDPGLILLSYAIAVFTSFTALELAVRTGESQGTFRKFWIGIRGCTMGGGIWAMHFTAMLAWKLPLTVTYDIGITLLSLLIAILGSSLAFIFSCTPPISSVKITSGGIAMGGAVATMHYTGMAAMQFTGSLHYKFDLFALSIIIAILASTTALWLATEVGIKKLFNQLSLKLIRALIMGLAIVGMHYTGMAATIFTTSGEILQAPQNTPDARYLALGISGPTLLILGAALLASTTQFLKLSGVKNELERMVEERTKDLLKEIDTRKRTEKELIRAKEEAERASQAKSEFLSRMSHELRTPLNAIMGFSQLLMRKKKVSLSPEQTVEVQHIHNAGDHLLSLINDVLDLSCIDSGTMSLSLEPVDVYQVVEEVFTLTRPLSEEKSIALINEIDSKNGFYILADPIRLNQVLLILVANAIKFNREGGTVTLSCEEVADANLKINVTDSGQGIPKEKQASLFEPFVQVQKENFHSDGMEIGLALSKGMMDLMHGEIDFTSIPDKGSYFYITLPLSPTSMDSIDDAGL